MTALIKVGHRKHTAHLKAADFRPEDKECKLPVSHFPYMENNELHFRFESDSTHPYSHYYPHHAFQNALREDACLANNTQTWPEQAYTSRTARCVTR